MKEPDIITRKYSDAEYVEGVYKQNQVMARALNYHCKKYFDNNFRGVFFVKNEHKDKIYHEAFIKLWENIMDRKIYVEEGILKGKDGEKFSGKLTTYFMSIAKIKFLEWTRENPPKKSEEEEERKSIKRDMEQYEDILYDTNKDVMLDIIADCLSHMSKRCLQILTMTYHEEKKLDEIMKAIPEYENRHALIANRSRCLSNLRKEANAIYRNYLNSKPRTL